MNPLYHCVLSCVSEARGYNTWIAVFTAMNSVTMIPISHCVLVKRSSIRRATFRARARAQ